jgi:hypothetical protein
LCFICLSKGRIFDRGSGHKPVVTRKVIVHRLPADKMTHRLAEDTPGGAAFGRLLGQMETGTGGHEPDNAMSRNKVVRGNVVKGNEHKLYKEKPRIKVFARFRGIMGKGNDHKLDNEMPGNRVSGRSQNKNMDKNNLHELNKGARAKNTLPASGFGRPRGGHKHELGQHNTSGFGRLRGGYKHEFGEHNTIFGRTHGTMGKDNVHKLDEHTHNKDAFARFRGKTNSGKLHGVDTNMSDKTAVGRTRAKMGKGHGHDGHIHGEFRGERNSGKLHGLDTNMSDKKAVGRSRAHMGKGHGHDGHTHGGFRGEKNNGKVHGHGKDVSDKKAVERLQGKLGHDMNVKMELKGTFLRHGGTHAFDIFGEKLPRGKSQPRKQDPEYIVDNGDLPSQDGRLN